MPTIPQHIGGVVVIVIAPVLLLPMLALSLIGVLLIEAFILRRIPAVRDWLGLRPANG